MKERIPVKDAIKDLRYRMMEMEQGLSEDEADAAAIYKRVQESRLEDDAARAVDYADVQAYRAWVRSDAYWLRGFTAAALNSGLPPGQAVRAAIKALAEIRETEANAKGSE